MDKTIKFRVKKEIDNNSDLKVLKLKGTLITKGFTEIIHIADGFRMKISILIHFQLRPIIKERRKNLYWIIFPVTILQIPLPFWAE